MTRADALRALLEEAHRGDFHFPTSAKLAIRIKETLDDPECHLESAEKLIVAEPLLAARVIGIANSVAYNPGGMEITDIRAAVARLGFKTLRTLAMAFVARQMAGEPVSDEQQRLAGELWQHTAHVSALCHVLAAKVTKGDKEAALFAGLVHEIGGFYLLSRVGQFPALLSSEDTGDIDLMSTVNTLSLAVLRNLGVPDPVIDAVEAYAEGELARPPRSQGDVLVLADGLAPVLSPFSVAAADAATVEAALANGTIQDVLTESADEVASLTRALSA